MMILGPVSLIDCLVFVILLIPQLLLQLGLVRTVLSTLEIVPFVLIQLPFSFIKDRFFVSKINQNKFVRGSTLFEDFVVRCVRYAFAGIPASVGRVFFSKPVALPFIRWRMLRHGYLRCPIYWKEYSHGEGKEAFKGVWIMHKPEQPPDFVLYYAHGGGFAMGSCYFYLEFLMVWHTLLVEAGYDNPAVFALDYTLAPDDIYPKQILETIQGYRHVLETVNDSSKICVAGDSAGGTLILSLLQELGAQAQNQKKETRSRIHGSLADPKIPAMGLPRMATLISPWITLMTHLHSPSEIDYLDRFTLWKYAHEYAGTMINQHPASPGSCTDEGLWKASTPKRGLYIIYGEEELFAPDIENFLQNRKKAEAEVSATRIDGGIHAWPVASLFLSSTAERRLFGLRSLVNEIRKRSDEHTHPKKGKGRKIGKK